MALDRYAFFIDDGGNHTTKSNDVFFVLGGLAIPFGAWKTLDERLKEVKTEWGIPAKQELKWADLGIRISQLLNPGQNTKPSTLAHLGSVDEVRAIGKAVLSIAASEADARILACLCVKATKETRESLLKQSKSNRTAYEKANYRRSLNDLLERYELFLRGLERGNTNTHGIVVIDEKSARYDNIARAVCDMLRDSGTIWQQPAEHIVETAFVVPSDASTGVQLADFVCGAIHRAFEKKQTDYLDIVRPLFHANGAGRIIGCGLKVCPSKYAGAVAKLGIV